MNRGGKAALLISCVGLGGCSASTSEVKVRPLADPASAYRNGSDSVAVARGQLVLGNVGLALEGFRKAQRDNPTDPAALAGIADCYSAMGRYDLAQSNYEAALAFAPHDRRLLLALATVFEREGKIASALAARAEADAALPPAPPAAQHAAVQPAAPQLQVAPAVKAQAVAKTAVPVSARAAPASSRWADSAPPQVRIEASPLVAKSRAVVALSTPAIVADAAPPAASVPVPPQPAAKPVMAVGSITVALPPPRPVEHFEMHAAPLKVAQVQYDFSHVQSSVTMAEPPPVRERVEMRSAPLNMATAQYDYSSLSAPVIVSALQPSVRERLDMRAAPLKVADAEYDYSRLSSSVTVQLPPARRVRAETPAPGPRPLPKPIVPTMVVEASGPRLERLSRGEVALVTTGKPIWAPQRDVQVASAGNLRWVSLASLNARPNVKILNAARTNLLAASARTVLLNRGWRKIAVGDAPAVQLKSEVQYPKNQATLGRRLAAQFGVAARMVERDVLVLVLGRDSVDRIARPQKS